MRGSCILPGPKPGARLDVVMPLRWLGCTGKGSDVMDVSGGGFKVAVTGVEVNEEERECLVVSAAAAGLMATCELGEVGAYAGCVAARFSGSPLAETSKSGKVMKKRQPNVVPKKAPSTD